MNARADLLKFGENNILDFKNNLLLGGAFNTSTNLMLYNNWESHSFPIAVNTYMNVLLDSVGLQNVSITTINHPIQSKNEETSNVSVLIINFSRWKGDQDSE